LVDAVIKVESDYGPDAIGAAGEIGLMQVRPSTARLFYVPLYTVLHITVMRMVRPFAIVREIVFRSSYRDLYVPSHFMRQVDMV